MLTHGDWHDFTVLKCNEVRKIYRDHPYGLKFHHIILPLCFYISFTLHNSTRLHAHPTVIKKMKTFLEVEGKMGPFQCQLVNSDLHCQKPILTLERTMPQRRRKEQHLRSLGQQPQTYCSASICPYQRPHQNLRMMHPYL